MKYKCYIIDDEPLAIDVVKEHLNKLDQFEVAGTFTEPLKAFSSIKKDDIDLIFLDLEMPEINGLEFISSLERKPEIIITTAYREYAVEGFELNVLDYLVKPIAFNRFLKGIDKFLEKKKKTIIPTKETEKGYLLIKSDRKKMKLFLSDILYIEGLKDYVKIVTIKGELLTKESVGNFYLRLPSNEFFRIHKSFIIPVNLVTAYTSHDVEIGKIQIPVGRSYKNEYLRLIHDIEKR